jgi:hypothetical protein
MAFHRADAIQPYTSSGVDAPAEDGVERWLSHRTEPVRDRKEQRRRLHLRIAIHIVQKGMVHEGFTMKSPSRAGSCRLRAS